MYFEQIQKFAKSVKFRDFQSDPDSKKLIKWMGPIWQAQLGQSLVMLTGPSWETQFIALLGTRFGAH